MQEIINCDAHPMKKNGERFQIPYVYPKLSRWTKECIRLYFKNPYRNVFTFRDLVDQLLIYVKYWPAKSQKVKVHKFYSSNSIISILHLAQTPKFLKNNNVTILIPFLRERP